MQYIIASVASLGLLFAWATSVVFGFLEIGAGLEPTIFAISAGAPLLLLVAGVISVINYHHRMNRLYSRIGLL
ncbi:hypothetical protein [Azospira oryzae]|uniref:hypothetical protein n=1 Tax=Azospira oryzae TaxID=146939 RepID=UPI0005C253FB|nr:hypothetical protein [Azospira oryzae]